MRIFVFLHVATMFTAVAMAIGVPTVLWSIAKSGDVLSIRRSFALAQPFIKAIPALFGLGAVLGSWLSSRTTSTRSRRSC